MKQPKYPQLFSADGNMRSTLDINHGSLTHRHKEIESECRQRNIVIVKTSDEQDEKMQKIKEFHQNTHRKFGKLKID